MSEDANLRAIIVKENKAQSYGGHQEVKPCSWRKLDGWTRMAFASVVIGGLPNFVEQRPPPPVNKLSLYLF